MIDRTGLLDYLQLGDRMGDRLWRCASPNYFLNFTTLPQLCKVGLSALILVSLLSSTATAEEKYPNLDGESHPERVKMAQCLADVREVTSWSEEETQNAANNVCESRRQHAQKKAQFIEDLRKLTEEYQDQTNHGYAEHLPIAINDAWTTVKSCIDFKEGFTYPHNIGLLLVPESIRQECYTFGSSLVKSQLP